MNGQIVVFPASPALIPELAPQHAPSRALLAAASRHLKSAVEAAASGSAAPVPIRIVGSRNHRWYTARVGSFAAWGAPQVNVGEGNYLPELIARYLLRRVDPAATRYRVAETATRLHPAARIAGSPEPSPSVTLVAADGSAGIGKKAPLSGLPGARESHEWCTAVLSGRAAPPATADVLRAQGICEPEPWLDLYSLREGSQVRCTGVINDDSLGVGRYVARWEV